MTYANLAEFAEAHAYVRTFLEDMSLSSSVAADTLNNAARDDGLDFRTSERSVRRWRTDKFRWGNQDAGPLATSQQWTPGVDVDHDRAELRTEWAPAGEAPAYDDETALAEMGLDPGLWTVVNMRYSKWQKTATPPTYFESRKYSARRREQDVSVPAMSHDEFMQIITAPRTATLVGNSAPPSDVLMVPAGDLQLGKIDGEGTDGIIKRFIRLTDEIADMARRCIGIKMLILPWLGDCIEGDVAMGGKLVTRLDMTVTEQVHQYQRLMAYQLSVLAPLAEKVIVPVVPGNHDDPTRQYQSSSTLDSWAIAGARNVETMLHFNRSDYDHVLFVYPEEEEMSTAIDIGHYSGDPNAMRVAFTHGHLIRNPNKVTDWWAKQAHGRMTVGDADLLVSAHFHHHREEQTGGGKSWIQIPALDGGSAYYRRRTGQDAVAGMMSIWLTPGEGLGYRNVTVHT